MWGKQRARRGQLNSHSPHAGAAFQREQAPNPLAPEAPHWTTPGRVAWVGPLFRIAERQDSVEPAAKRSLASDTAAGPPRVRRLRLPRCQTLGMADDDPNGAALPERLDEPVADDAAGIVVREVLGLVEGAHVHLDDLLAGAPPPGSPDWLPLLGEVIDLLARREGVWLVTMPIGFAAVPPKITDLDVATAIRQAAEFRRASRDGDPFQLAEPPAVYRGHSVPQPARWSGVSHSWQRRLSNAVHRTIVYNKDEDAIALDEPYSLSVTWQIDSPARGA